MQPDIDLYVSYNNCMEELESIRETHPNIYELWKNTLQKKVNSLQRTMNEATHMLQNAKDIPDLTKEQILCMYLFAK